ncbi:Annexin A3 35-alpha calcimedin [Triplophysa tibetana]|uniref:Annexin n=1 Tax=Triplophysa tibetana TaxID=1572043 RepID=A0A5A9P5R9_9TELE|nr:Annexin A3 35-alpha calcimedin [Triplophysa tibetana]
MAHVWDDLESMLKAPYPPVEKGTIKPHLNFKVNEDVETLCKAIQGFGTDEKSVIDILTHRSSNQKQAISRAYEEKSKRILVNDLKSDTGGDFEDVLVRLATLPAVNDAKDIIKATKGAGTDKKILIEILASRTNKQIKELSAAYADETKKTLVQNLKHEVSGDFGKAIVSLAEAARDESTSVNANKAKEDAQALYNAGEKKFGTDESKFVEILCKRSIPQLRQTLVEYKNISGKTLQKSIEKEMSGEMEELLVAIVKCIMNTPAYFAEKLHESMKGIGTHESMLTRIMVSRAEVDMMDIKAEYKKLYQSSLYKQISSDVTGNYCDCLRMICGED